MAEPHEDPIMAELYAIREAYAAKFDYDPVALIKHLQAKEAASGRTYITFPPKPAPPRCHACGQPTGSHSTQKSSSHPGNNVPQQEKDTPNQ